MSGRGWGAQVGPAVSLQSRGASAASSLPASCWPPETPSAGLSSPRGAESPPSPAFQQPEVTDPVLPPHPQRGWPPVGGQGAFAGGLTVCRGYSHYETRAGQEGNW